MKLKLNSTFSGKKDTRSLWSLSASLLAFVCSATAMLWVSTPPVFAQSTESPLVIDAFDFSDIAAGQVPFYRDTAGNRNVLAINAVIESYRDVFARAVTTFSDASGFYDLTLTTLGEIDGEGEYRLLVNGGLIGEVVNARVDEDWGEQLFLFENVELHAGYQIAVEAKAVSNGLIPENGEFAFARGRWRSLQFVLDEDASSAFTGLALQRAERSIQSDGSIIVSATYENKHESTTATGLEMTVSAIAPYSYQFRESDECVCSVDQLVCSLPDLEPGEQGEMDLILAESTYSQLALELSLVSEQSEQEGDNPWQVNFDFFDWTGNNEGVDHGSPDEAVSVLSSCTTEVPESDLETAVEIESPSEFEFEIETEIETSDESQSSQSNPSSQTSESLSLQSSTSDADALTLTNVEENASPDSTSDVSAITEVADNESEQSDINNLQSSEPLGENPDASPADTADTANANTEATDTEQTPIVNAEASAENSGGSGALGLYLLLVLSAALSTVRRRMPADRFW